MKYYEMSIYLNELSDFLNSRDNMKVEIVEVVNPDNVPFIGDKTNKNKHSIPYPPSSKLSKTSGIYIFIAEDGTVLYIGKAGENNVGDRIWDHIKTPEPSDREGWVIFPKNKFNSDIIREGKAKVGIFEVEPSTYSSLVEVYLQTIFFEHIGQLPKLNSRLG